MAAAMDRGYVRLSLISNSCTCFLLALLSKGVFWCELLFSDIAVFCLCEIVRKIVVFGFVSIGLDIK